MEPKKWVYGVLLIFMILVIGLSVMNQLVRDSTNGVQSSSLIGMVKIMILSMAGQNKVVETPGHIILSPNLTTCHQSYTRAGQSIYCCPPKRESEGPVIDFQFPNPSLPTKIRRPAHRVDKDYIAKYNKAVEIMKSLPYEDPRSYLRQANMHCIYCTGAYNQQHSNALLNVHRSWLFFPWHRMMIYFHERILGSLIGDDLFALPFWNWDTPEGMFIPDMYMNGTLLDLDRELGHLPPQAVDLDYARFERGLGLQEQIEANVAFMYHQMVSGAKKNELFMGCPYKSGEDGFCDSPGTVELAPHNTLHAWVGNPLNIERENMGSFYSAARDPIFYAHHSNIDRLWEVWRGLHPDIAEITDPDWLNSYFFFHDEKLQLVRIKVSDVLDITKLKYTFEPVENQWLNARPKPAVAPKIARHMMKIRDNENNFQLPSHIANPHFGHKGQTLDTMIRVRVPRPRKGRSKKEKQEEEEILVIYGIDVKTDKYVKFDVFINAVDETTIGVESREFAGTFVNMRSGVRLVMNKEDLVAKKKTNLKLGILELLEDLEADGDESIWVTLVQRGGIGVRTTIEGIRIEYMK